MKRSSKKKVYRKIGGGMFRLPNMQWVKTGDVFEAASKDIPKAFKDLLVEVPEIKKNVNVPVVTGYEKRERSPGWWDIFDSNNKMMNETAMREKDADKLIEDWASVLAKDKE